VKDYAACDGGIDPKLFFVFKDKNRFRCGEDLQIRYP
jgi:hypothetical protein